MSPFISDELKAEILRANDIVQVVSSYVPLKRSGKNFVALCPFHKEKTPSFYVHPDRQTFKCYGCGEGGDVISFIMKYERVDFVEAIQILADRARIDISKYVKHGGGPRVSSEQRRTLLRTMDWAAGWFQSQLKNSTVGQRARDYLEKRGFGEDMIEAFRLGYAPEGWENLARAARGVRISDETLIQCGLVGRRQQGGGVYDYFRHRLMFPIPDTQGRVVGFGGRTLGDDPAKYINSPDTVLFNKGRLLYGIWAAREAILERREAVIVEGYTDVIVAHQAGIRHVVGVLGTALTKDHIALLRRYADRVVVVFDGDSAGLRSAERSAELFLEEDMPLRLVGLPAGEDPFDFVRNRGGDAFRDLIERGDEVLDFKLKQIETRLDLRSLDGRTAATRELVALAAKCPDPIRRDLLFKRIAEMVGVEEDAVRSAARRIQFAAERRELTSQTPTPKQPDAVREAQRDLIAMMLNQNELIPDVEGQLGLEGFSDQALRRVAEKIFEVYREEAMVDFRRLLEVVDDPGDTELIADIGAKEGEREPDRRRAEDEIAYLLKQRSQKETAELRQRIIEAAKHGDEETERELLARFARKIQLAKRR